MLYANVNQERAMKARWCGYCQRSPEGCVCPPWMPNTGTDDERKARGARQEAERICRFPDCRCPMDPGPEPDWCARGLPHARGHNPPMPLSSKEKQEAFRARNAMLGLTEVRGIYAPPELHAAIKEAARKLVNAPAQKQPRTEP